VRVDKALDEAASTTVDVPSLRGGAARVNLNEEHIEGVARGAGGVAVNARRNEIVSLRFRG
jgi:hypothetical protein